MYHSEVLCHTTFLLCIGGFWSLSRVKTMTQALASVHTQLKQFQPSSVIRLFQHFGVILLFVSPQRIPDPQL
jgi:hypothetical protein